MLNIYKWQYSPSFIRLEKAEKDIPNKSHIDVITSRLWCMHLWWPPTSFMTTYLHLRLKRCVEKLFEQILCRIYVVDDVVYIFSLVALNIANINGKFGNFGSDNFCLSLNIFICVEYCILFDCNSLFWWLALKIICINYKQENYHKINLFMWIFLFNFCRSQIFLMWRNDYFISISVIC